MRKVKAPNGLILDLPDQIASGLVGSRNHPDFEYVDDPAVNAAPVEMPKPYAPKPDWVEYAVSEGMSRDEAKSLSKKALIARLT